MSPYSVDPRSVLLVTLDSCRYDTFVAAHAPNMKSVGLEVHRAQAPSHFTYGSHLSMFVGFTPGVAGVERPYVNPKFAKLFRLHNEGRRPHGPAAFELQGRSLAQGFGQAGYRTLGSGAMAWFNPQRPHGEFLTADFGKFFYPGDLWSVDRQAAWFDMELDATGDTPVFAFINVGETHAPYWHKGATWSAEDNPCVPFQHLDRSADCAARQRSCLEYIDTSLAKLLSRFARATIIVTADHGDCWGEDGLWEHTICHEAVLNVPLVFRVNADIDADRSRRHDLERRSSRFLNLAIATLEETGISPPQEDCQDASTVTSDSILSLRKDIIVTTMDSEVVLADTVHETCHAAGSVGSRIIGLLDGKRRACEIAENLAAIYEVDAPTCEQEVLAFLRKMQDQRLLIVGP